MRPLTSEDPEYLGPHRLTHRLGAGGMGQVYLARSPGGLRVVVKTILPHHAGEWLYRHRFVREVEAARQVGGFHTAPVVGADPWAEQPWVATAYVPGPTLNQAVRDHGVWDAAGLWALTAGLAEGLAAIHRQGLVHRDVKPGNVILTAARPLIIDFGLARFPLGGTVTARGRIAGTVPYMSPEQTLAGDDERVGPASDVFSLGTVIVFAATGTNPFRAGTHRETMRRIQGLEPGLGRVPEVLRPLLRGCWEKDPNRRPTAEQVLDRVGGTDLGEGWPPPHLPLLPEPTDPADAPTDSETTSPPPGETLPSPGGSAVSPGPAERAAPGREGAGVLPEDHPSDAGRALALLRSHFRAVLVLGTVLVVAAVLLFALGVRPLWPTGSGPAEGSAALWAERDPEAVHGPAFDGFEAGWMSVSPAGEVTLTSPDGVLRTGGPDGSGVWEERMVLDHGRDPNPLVFFTVDHHPDGDLTAAAWHDLVMVWDAAAEEATTLLEGRGEVFRQPAFDPEGDLLAVPEHSGSVFVLDTATWEEVAALDGLPQYARALFDPGGTRLAAIGQEGDGGRGAVVQLWDTDGWELLDELTAPAEYVLSAVFAPGGEHLVTAGATTRVFPLAGSADSTELARPQNVWLSSLAAHPDVDFVAGALGDDRVHVWDPVTWAASASLTGHGAAVRTVALSPDGTVLASGDDEGAVRVWDTRDWSLLHEFEENSAWTHSLDFSADGRILAAASLHEVVLWSV